MSTPAAARVGEGVAEGVVEGVGVGSVIAIRL
jgi:hypothetical protein